MARDKVVEPVRPSTMKELKDTLWKAADKLRGSMEASQYKDVVLGLIFLKYVSDAFDERQREIEEALQWPTRSSSIGTPTACPPSSSAPGRPRSG